MVDFIDQGLLWSKATPLSIKKGSIDNVWRVMFPSPVFFSFFDQINKFMVAEKMLPGKVDEVAERNFTFKVLFDNSKKQVGYKCAPYLYFDGIFIVA